MEEKSGVPGVTNVLIPTIMSQRFLKAEFLVFLLFLTSLYPEERTLRVWVFGDEEFRTDAGWKFKAAQAVQKASDDFHRSFEIVLSIEKYGDWNSPDSLTSLDLVAFDLETKVHKKEADFLIVFSAQKTLDQRYSGYALSREGVILIQEFGDLSRQTRVLEHELAHLFGAVHLNDPSSVMDVLGRGYGFDALTSSLIRLNRNRSFNPVYFPIPKENRPKAAEIYKKILAGMRVQKSQGRGGAKKFMAGTNPDDQNLEDVHLILAQIYTENRQYDEALTECQKAMKLNPLNLENLNQMGIILRKKGLIDEAIEKYKKALEVKSGQPRVWYNLGIAYSKRGDFEASAECYRKAIGLLPNYAEAYGNLGELLLRTGKDKEAEDQFRQAISHNPEYGLAYSNLAEVLFRKADFRGALEQAEKAITYDAGLPGPHCVKGKIFRERGELDKAKGEFEMAISLDPLYEKAYYNLGHYYLDKNSVDEAKGNFIKAVEIKSRFAEAHASLGYCLLLTGQTDEAIRELNLALELGFKSPRTHLNLSRAYLDKNLPSQAVQEAQKALQLDPSCAPAINNLGIAYIVMGRAEEAIAQFKKSIDLNPKNNEALVNLGNIYLGMERLDAALDLYAKALESDPANAMLHNNIAGIYFRKGEYRLSWEHAQKAESLGFKVHPDFLKELKKKLKAGER